MMQNFLLVIYSLDLFATSQNKTHSKRLEIAKMLIMKTLLRIFIIGITCLFSFSVKSQESSFDPNKLKVEFFEDAQIKDGLIFDDDKGNSYKIKNSKYSNGVYIKKNKQWLKHGVFYTLSDGRKTAMTTYYYGKKHGAHESYYKNGKTQFQYTFENNLKEGSWYQYRENGALVRMSNYKNNLKDGMQFSYHFNGKEEFVTPYVNGLKHGGQLHYNDKGKFLSSIQYEMGKSLKE
jgi:antitoxin component YwqK of YwqJK toxin-antitoxin module